MRPIPIPDDAVHPNAHRLVLSSPSGDLTDTEVAPLEVLLEPVELLGVHTPAWSSRWVLEPGELEALQAGAVLEVTLTGIAAHPPIAIRTIGPKEVS